MASKEINEIFTIEDLKFIKLFFTLKHFHIDGDGIRRLDFDDPGTSLGVGVVLGKAWAKDHAR